MQCSMLPRIRYLEVGRMLLEHKETVRAKIRTLSRNHIIRQPPQQWANGVISLMTHALFLLFRQLAGLQV